MKITRAEKADEIWYRLDDFSTNTLVHAAKYNKFGNIALYNYTLYRKSYRLPL